MSLVIEMPAAVEAKVREKCARVGRAVDEVAVDVFEAWLGEERPVERFGDLPMCGMWKDREDMANPEAWGTSAHRRISLVFDTDVPVEGLVPVQPPARMPLTNFRRSSRLGR